MKKQILLLSLVIISSTVWSQKDIRIPSMEELLSEGKQSISIPIEKDLGITVWSDNFDDPATWALENNGQGGVDYGWNINDVSEGWWAS